MSVPSHLPTTAHIGHWEPSTSDHEDLTIAESLETMRTREGQLTGVHHFLCGCGRSRFIDDGALSEFLAKHGKLSPSHDLARYGIDWKINFFNTEPSHSQQYDTRSLEHHH